MELYVERCSDFLRMRTQAIEIGDDENPTELIPPCPIKFWASQVSSLEGLLLKHWLHLRRQRRLS